MIVKLNNFQHTLQRYELMTYVLNVTEGLFIAINKKVCKSLVLVNFRRLHFRQSKLWRWCTTQSTKETLCLFLKLTLP